MADGKKVAVMPNAQAGVFSNVMYFSKSTPGTIVFVSDELRTFYIPKEILAKIFGKEVPKQITVTIA